MTWFRGLDIIYLEKESKSQFPVYLEENSLILELVNVQVEHSPESIFEIEMNFVLKKHSEDEEQNNVSFSFIIKLNKKSGLEFSLTEFLGDNTVSEVLSSKDIKSTHEFSDLVLDTLIMLKNKLANQISNALISELDDSLLKSTALKSLAFNNAIKDNFDSL